MSINRAMGLLVAELAEGDVPAPLSQAFTLAAVWTDLCRLAGEPLPRAVAVLADLPVTLGPAARAARRTGPAPRHAD